MRTADPHASAASARPDRRVMAAAAPPQTLRDTILRAGQDLFAAYGIELTQGGSGLAPAPRSWVDEPHQMAFLGIVGLGGPTFAAHVVLCADERLLCRSNSTSSSSDDWMAELANQFLGRIKNHLLRQGITMHRIPPLVIKGPAIALGSRSDGAVPMVLGDGQDRVLIWMDEEPATEGTVAHEEPAAEVLNEGEMVLF